MTFPTTQAPSGGGGQHVWECPVCKKQHPTCSAHVKHLEKSAACREAGR